MLGRLIPRAGRAFESRTDEWRQVGLGAEVDRQQAQRARGGALVALALIGAVIVVFSRRAELFPGLGIYVRIATVAALVLLGWVLARSLGRGLGPTLYRRMEPGTAGTLGFLTRLLTIAIVTVIALRIAGLHPGALAVGGAFTAVILGLAAQQTLGNVFAGTVLLGTRPFRVGERVRLQGGFLAGQVEGIVGSLGLFYTTLVSGADRIMVPNSVLLQLAVIPLREPARVELRARFAVDTTPGEVQRTLSDSISVPLRYPPHVAVAGIDRDGVGVRIVSTPEDPGDGAAMTAQIMSGVRAADGARAANGA